MKRFLTVFLAILMTATLLSACGPASEKPSASVTPSSGISASPSSDAASPSVKNPAESSAPSEASPSEAAVSFVRGEWNDKVYSNAFAGLKYTLPEGWVAASDEEIASMMGLASDVLTDKQQWMIEAAKLTSIYDMFVQDPASGNNIAVVFENLEKSGALNYTEEDYLKAVEKQFTDMETLKYTFDKPYDTTINGTVYLTARTTESTKNLTQYYLIHKQNGYMVDMVVTILDDTKIDDIIAQFK